MEETEKEQQLSSTATSACIRQGGTGNRGLYSPKQTMLGVWELKDSKWQIGLCHLQVRFELIYFNFFFVEKYDHWKHHRRPQIL